MNNQIFSSILTFLPAKIQKYAVFQNNKRNYCIFFNLNNAVCYALSLSTSSQRVSGWAISGGSLLTLARGAKLTNFNCLSGGYIPPLLPNRLVISR
jgi:hypothetical protein